MSLAGHDGRVAFLKKAKPKRKHSEETNQKISATLRRRKQAENSDETAEAME